MCHKNQIRKNRTRINKHPDTGSKETKADPIAKETINPGRKRSKSRSDGKQVEDATKNPGRKGSTKVERRHEGGKEGSKAGQESVDGKEASSCEEHPHILLKQHGASSPLTPKVLTWSVLAR